MFSIRGRMSSSFVSNSFYAIIFGCKVTSSSSAAGRAAGPPVFIARGPTSMTECEPKGLIFCLSFLSFPDYYISRHDRKYQGR